MARQVQASKFRALILLPKTKFLLRTNPITQEPAIQKLANFDELYKWQQEARKNSNRIFTLHDGPPYANGDPHMGHVLNKVLKDFINRYKLMQGYRVNYRPGWDCHGLPIELKACQNLNAIELSPLKIRSKAAQFARKTMAAQREAFKRWGCLGDWENPYVTMDREYEADQLKVFHEMYKQGCIYRGFKPVYWSPSTGTALAEAELEYKEHASQAVYVLFPLANSEQFKTDLNVSHHSPVYVAVWTTTPWTLLANKAICYGPNHTYSLVSTQDERLVLLSKTSLSRLDTILKGAKVVAQISSEDLKGLKYTNPLNMTGEAHPFIPGTHVTETEGTGFVHTAPAHGFEDYQVGVQNELGLDCCVDDHGRYTSGFGSEYKGLFVLEEGNKQILEKLANKKVLLHQHIYSHRYPYDWRSKKPIIIRSTEQWFASVKQLKNDAVAAIKSVKMHPESSINRIIPMLGSREDWCISRQRVWGVPLPIFYHKDTGEVLLEDKTIEHVEKLFREKGSDCWWRLPTFELLPPSLRSQADNYFKGTDTMDVWFDSGSSWAAVLKESSGVADMYLEGSDQHRGWFQSSLLTSVATQGKAPYRSVVTHGFVLDGKGNKMSKSLGNVISPEDILHTKKFGADVIRLWVASTNYANISGVNLSDEILQQMSESLQRIRNSVRFLLGNLSEFDPNHHLVPHEQLSKLDQYLLHILANYCKLATESFESLNFSRVYQALVHLFPTDLSAFYFDIIKDTLYCDHPQSIKRQSVTTTLHHLVNGLVKSIAPILPHLAEEVVQHYPFEQGSVFQCEWPNPPSQWTQPQLSADFEAIRSVRAIINKALDIARNERAIRSSLEAHIHLTIHSPHLFSLLSKYEKAATENLWEFALHELFIVSDVTLSTDQIADSRQGFTWSETVEFDGEECKVQATCTTQDAEPAKFKCPRCWKYCSSSEETLCERCTQIVFSSSRKL